MAHLSTLARASFGRLDQGANATLARISLGRLAENEPRRRGDDGGRSYYTGEAQEWLKRGYQAEVEEALDAVQQALQEATPKTKEIAQAAIDRVQKSAPNRIPSFDMRKAEAALSSLLARIQAAREEEEIVLLMMNI